MSQESKRQTIMADRLLAVPAGGMLMEKKDENILRDHLLEAKRFVLDTDGARYAAQIVRHNPQMVARNMEFAIPAFKKMYVELPFLVFYSEATGRMPDAEADSTVGFLFVGPKLYVASENTQTTRAVLLPWYYWLNRPWTREEEGLFADKLKLSRKGLDAFFWGEALAKLTEEEQRSMREYHSMWPISEKFVESKEARAIWTNVFDTSAGDLRNAIALLLLLNRSGDYVYEEQFGPHRAFYRAKPRTFLSHSVVRFRMDPIKRVMHTAGVSGAWRREHDVKGHFCHDKTARGAQQPFHQCKRDEFGEPSHHWTEYGVNLWRCLKCGGLRWWRRDCRRGTRDKGKVTTTYEVTAHG